jgi:tetratricopeptide (TPR) repeat protein
MESQDSAGTQKGIDLFQQAIKLDPSYAAAYSGIADCYTALGYGSFLAPKEAFPKALEAATRALQLDSTLAEPHASLGYYRFYFDWDWAAAEQEFRAAISLNPKL